MIPPEVHNIKSLCVLSEEIATCKTTVNFLITFLLSPLIFAIVLESLKIFVLYCLYYKFQDLTLQDQDEETAQLNRVYSFFVFFVFLQSAC